MDIHADERIHYELCQINELHHGQMKEFEVKTARVQTSVLLIRQNDRFYAYANKCCHYKLPLAKGVLVGNHLRCFAHGACFRVDTGDIEDHPGHGHLPKYTVEIVNDRVILITTKRELERIERINIPENISIDMKPIVAIIGAGASGFTCADMLRQNGFRGRILLISREGILPYDRVQLSKQPSKKVEDLLLRDQPYFNRAKIDLLLNTEVTDIDWHDKRFVYKTSTNESQTISYDYLVLATGLRPRRLPSSLPGSNLGNIFYLRSFEDAHHIVHAVKAPETKNIVIIGDSFIALELCGWLTTGLEEKKNVSVVMRSEIPMQRIFGERIGRALQKLHEKNGAKFYSQAIVTQLVAYSTKSNRIKSVELRSGDCLPCEVVLVAIGSELCTELYQNSPIALTQDGFIQVNEHLQTSVENVLAVGDICKYPLKVFDLEDINCQHWQMACSTGHQAAQTILRSYRHQTDAASRSLRAKFYTVPIYWSTQNNKTTIRYAGYTRDPENVIIHGDLDEEFRFVAYYIVDGYVRAVAQSKLDPLSSEIAEIFYHQKNIRQEDIQLDMYGYRKYLNSLTNSVE